MSLDKANKSISNVNNNCQDKLNNNQEQIQIFLNKIS